MYQPLIGWSDLIGTCQASNVSNEGVAFTAFPGCCDETWDGRHFPSCLGAAAGWPKRCYVLGLFLCVDCNHGVTIAPPFHGYFISFFFRGQFTFWIFWTCSIFGWLMLVARCSECLPSCHLQCSWPSRKVRCEWQRCQKRSAAACSVGSTRGWPWGGHGATVVRSLLAQITPRKHAPAIAMPGAWDVKGKHEKSIEIPQKWRFNWRM